MHKRRLTETDLLRTAPFGSFSGMRLYALGRLYFAALVMISTVFNELHSFAADVNSLADSNSALERDEVDPDLQTTGRRN